MPVIRNLVDWVGHVPHLAAQVAGDRVAAVRHRDILIARAVRGLCSVQRGDDAVMVKRWSVQSLQQGKRAHSASSRTSTTPAQFNARGSTHLLLLHLPPSGSIAAWSCFSGCGTSRSCGGGQHMLCQHHAINRVAAMGSVATQSMQIVRNHVHTCAGPHDISSAGRHCP